MNNSTILIRKKNELLIVLIKGKTNLGIYTLPMTFLLDVMLIVHCEIDWDAQRKLNNPEKTNTGKSGPPLPRTIETTNT